MMSEDENKKIIDLSRIINKYVEDWKLNKGTVQRIEKDIVLDALRSLYILVDELEASHNILEDIPETEFDHDKEMDDLSEDENIKKEDNDTIITLEANSEIVSQEIERKDDDNQKDVSEEIQKTPQDKEITKQTVIEDNKAGYFSDDSDNEVSNDDNKEDEEEPISSLLNYINLEELKQKRRNTAENLIEESQENKKPEVPNTIHKRKPTDEGRLEELYYRAIDFFQKNEENLNDIKEKNNKTESNDKEPDDLTGISTEEEVKIDKEFNQKSYDVNENNSHVTDNDDDKKDLSLKNKNKADVTPSLNDLFSSLNEDHSIGTVIRRKDVEDIKNIIDLNQRIAFIKNLFNGDSFAYSEAIKEINNSDSLENANIILDHYALKYEWDKHIETKEQLLYCTYLKFKK